MRWDEKTQEVLLQTPQSSPESDYRGLTEAVTKRKREVSLAMTQTASKIMAYDSYEFSNIVQRGTNA